MRHPPERNILLRHEIFMAPYFARKCCLPWSATKQAGPARICLCSNYIAPQSGAATRGAALGRYRGIVSHPVQEICFWRSPSPVQLHNIEGKQRHPSPGAWSIAVVPPPALFDNKQQSQPHGTFLAGPRGDGTALRVASVGKLL